MHPIEVEKVKAGVITSEPALKLKASTPIYSAEDPEFTYRQCFFQKSLQFYFQIF